MSKRDRSVWFDRQKINKFTLKNEESTFCNSVRVDPEVILSIQSEFSQAQDTSEMTEQFSLRQMNTEPFEKRSDNCIFVSETETLETPIFGVSMPISDLVNQGLFEKSLYTKLRSNSNTNQQSGNNNFIHAH